MGLAIYLGNIAVRTTEVRLKRSKITKLSNRRYPRDSIQRPRSTRIDTQIV